MKTLGKNSKTNLWNGSMMLWSLITLLLMKTSAGQQGDHILRQSTTCQKDIPSGDFGFYLDDDELFYVDLDTKEVVYRLPEIESVFSFEAQGGLQNLAVCRHNLDIYIKRTNSTSGPIVPPVVKVYPMQHVKPGKPNTLICATEDFFPCVLNISWSKNGIPVKEGITVTDFYPGKEFTFKRFAYLTFIPVQGDIYSCNVEHPGLDRPTTVFWQPDNPSGNENKTVSFSNYYKSSGVFLHQITADCLYMREGQKLVFLQTTLYNKERQVYFDSRIGKFIGITEFGKIEAEYWNNDTAYLEKMRAAIMIFCKHNFDLLNNTIMDRKVIPVVTMQPLRSVIEKHPNLLMCEASGFYPQSIRVTMLKNGEEVTRDISSSGLISNGDWTYQITLLMEFIPKKEDVYGCKVEHSSLNEPMIVEWRMEAYN
nr:nonclassical MHC class II protein MHC-IIabSol [Protopterus dolloi]